MKMLNKSMKYLFFINKKIKKYLVVFNSFIVGQANSVGKTKCR